MKRRRLNLTLLSSRLLLNASPFERWHVLMFDRGVRTPQERVDADNYSLIMRHCKTLWLKT